MDSDDGEGEDCCCCPREGVAPLGRRTESRSPCSSPSIIASVSTRSVREECSYCAARAGTDEKVEEKAEAKREESEGEAVVAEVETGSDDEGNTNPFPTFLFLLSA